MYSCDQNNTATRSAEFSSTKYQPCVAAAGSSFHHSARALPGQVSADAQPRRPKKRGYSARSSRRSSTTVVATDVSNFRAMVQELTGFPPAAIFRPLPRRVHVANPLPPVNGCVGTSCGGGGGGGGAVHGHSSDTATSTTAGNSIPDVPTVQPLMHPPQCAPPAPGVFDGLADLGSPELDAWADLCFE